MTLYTHVYLGLSTGNTKPKSGKTGQLKPGTEPIDYICKGKCDRDSKVWLFLNI